MGYQNYGRTGEELMRLKLHYKRCRGCDTIKPRVEFELKDGYGRRGTICLRCRCRNKKPTYQKVGKQHPHATWLKGEING